MGRVNFAPHRNSSVRGTGSASDFEARLRALPQHLSTSPFELAIEPQVTLAHEPHDSLELLNQLSGHRPYVAVDPQPATVPSSLSAAPAGEPQAPGEGRDPFDPLSLLTAIPNKHS